MTNTNKTRSELVPGYQGNKHLLSYKNIKEIHLFKYNKPDQSLVEPVAVVVVQTSSKIVRQLAGFNVTSQLIGRNQDHLTGSKDTSMQIARESEFHFVVWTTDGINNN